MGVSSEFVKPSGLTPHRIPVAAYRRTYGLLGDPPLKRWFFRCLHPATPGERAADLAATDGGGVTSDTPMPVAKISGIP